MTKLVDSLANIPVIIRIHAITIAAVVGLGLLTATSAVQLQSSLQAEAESRVKQIIETARGIINRFHELELAGKLTDEEARAQAVANLRVMRYEGTNYIFINTLDGVSVLNPGRPDMEGKKTTTVLPPGVKESPTPKMIALVNSVGSGFVHYIWPKPGVVGVQPKIAYVVGFKPWNWLIGSGVYVDDIAAKTDAALWHMAGFVLLIAIAVALMAFMLARSIAGPLRRAAHSIDRLAAGDLDTEIRDSARGDEMGLIARGLVELKDGAKRRVSLEKESTETRERNEVERQRQEAENRRAAEAHAFVVTTIADALQHLSEGDLTCRLSQAFPAQYERIRQDFNTAIDKLQQTVVRVTSNTHAIRSGSSEISRATDDLSRRTEQQAASLEETAAALDEITATVKKTAQNATHARDVVSTAKSDAARGGDVVRQAVDAMSGIEKSSHQIGQIIGVIDEIAFQTNLLALNAGVEAARAGEAGRGFAVVASEVRALAQRSAEAAKEIKGLIAASKAEVDQGVNLVAETGKALDRIVNQVSEINAVITEIAASAQEQATGLNEVNSAVSNMDHVTQQNAAMVEETTAASRSLAGESEQLMELVATFRTAQEQQAHEAFMARRAAKPASPKGVASAVGRRNGNAMPKAAEDNWEEF